MSEETEVLLAEVLSSFEGAGFSVPPKLFKEITEVMKAYADEQNKKLLDKIDKVYETGLSGISYVGAANYQSRESDARAALVKVYLEPLNK